MYGQCRGAIQDGASIEDQVGVLLLVAVLVAVWHDVDKDCVQSHCISWSQ